MTDTDLAVALSQLNYNEARDLIKHGVKLNDISPLNFKPMIFHLMEFRDPHNVRELDLIRMLKLFEKIPGFDINAQDREGYAPIHEAVRRRSPAFVQEMIEMGADVDAKSIDGSTPLFYAIHSPDMVRHLLLFGADATEMNQDFQTPMLHAAENGAPLETFAELIRAKVSVNSTDEVGHTPLMYAAQRGDVPLIKFLLERGADKTKTTMMNTKALDYADEQPENIKRLLR